MTSKSARPFVFALALAVALPGCDWLSSRHASAADAGTRTALAELSHLSGAVVLQRTGHTGPASVGPLFAGDLLETGADGDATVTFPGGRTVDLGPDGRMVIDREGNGLALRIKTGSLVSTVSGTPAHGERVALSILTPFGITRLGTDPEEIHLQVGASTAKLEVRLGTVQLVRRDGRKVTAKAGEAVQLTLGKITLVPAKPKVVELAPIRLVLHVSGRVYLRHQGERHAHRVRSATANVVAGDTVRVARGEGTLSLSGTSSEITLSSGAEVKVGPSGHQGDTDEAEIDPRRGALRIRMAEGRKSAFALGELKVSSDRGGQLEVSHSRRGDRLEALTGDFTISEGASTQKLSAGQTALASSKGISVRAVAEAAVRLPPWRNLRVFHSSALRQIALTWKAGSGGPYEVQVATDPRFANEVLRGAVHERFVNAAAPRGGSLYWRVTDSSGQSVASASAHFAPEPRRARLARLHNQVTEGSEKTTIYYQDRPPQVTFAAKADASAAKYRLAVYAMGNLGHPIANRTASTDKIALPAGALGEGKYVWSVTPLSSSGRPLRGGKMNKLEIVYDNSVPTLEIASPKNGQRARRTVTASGVAPVDSKLWIDGARVRLDGAHRFSVRVHPVGDPPVVIFRLHREGEPETFTVRTLRGRR